MTSQTRRSSPRDREMDRPRTPKTTIPSRLIGRDGRPTVRRVGIRPRLLRDLYFSLLRMSWPRLIVLLFAAYLAIIALFALAYLVDSEAIAGARPGRFSDAFFFSVETLATIGYGVFSPKSLYAHMLVTVEAFIGILAAALVTGLAFAKFSRPTAKVVFSERAVIGRFNGRSALMVRMANARTSQIAEAQVRVTLLRDEVTSEGAWMRRFYDLPLTRSWTPVFALTWTAMHIIDEASPLFGATPETLADLQAEFVVSFVGVDETLGQTVQTRFSYLASELVWNARFADVIDRSTSDRTIDYANLHRTEPLDG